MANDDELDTETRRGLRILADSTKAKGNDGAARRLYNAADTGSAADYQQAKALFDALPPEKRSSIQSTAETKATTLRETEIRRKSNPPTRPKSGLVEFAPWKLAESGSTEGVFQPQEPEQKRRLAAVPLRPEDTGKTWEPDGRADVPQKSDSDRNEEGNNWDWQKLPEGAASKTRRKANTPKDKLDALREEMLRTLKY